MLFEKPDRLPEPLYCIVPLQNPWRWRSRWKHTERAVKHFMDSGAVVVLIEAAFGRREFAFADSGIHGLLAADGERRHMHIGVRGAHELWLKENLINIAAARLPSDWQQLCFLDSDVHFLRPNWAGETVHKLQHYAWLQMFSHARDLGPNYEMLPADFPHADGLGFVNAWQQGGLDNDIRRLREATQRVKRDASGSAVLAADAAKVEADVEQLAKDAYPYPSRAWPGLAWAVTRKAFEDVGGLPDFAVWGGGDWHMAHALIEKTDNMVRNDMHRNYKKLVNQWYERCRTHVRRNVGVVEGTIVHHWHGRKTQRGYNIKHKLLADLGFDPPRHLKRDFQGLYQLHDDGTETFVGMRDILRRIATERNEDSIDVYVPEFDNH